MTRVAVLACFSLVVFSYGTTYSQQVNSDSLLQVAPELLESEGGIFQELSFRLAIDGSKQPQDFGVNANVGGQAAVNWGVPIFPDLGIGLQMGTNITATDNAVRVFELLGETSGRTQSYSTMGIFRRGPNGFGFGVVHDFLYQKGFDSFSLGQWRGKITYDLTPNDQLGVTAFLKSYSDNGVFGASTNVTLNPIDQIQFSYRKFWQTGAQTTFSAGIAEGHGEDNAVTGFSPAKSNQFVFGADLLLPLNNHFAIYGESNLMMPADTGVVDGFLGIQWTPRKLAANARRGRFSPMLSTASPPTFAVDLERR